MGEFRDGYPEAYGHGEDIELRDPIYLARGLPRQVRGGIVTETECG
jgi:hypothetical protein